MGGWKQSHSDEMWETPLAMSQERGQPLEVPRASTKEHSSANTLILVHWESFRTTGLQNCKITNLCCFKPLSFGDLWQQLIILSLELEISQNWKKVSEKLWDPLRRQNMLDSCPRDSWQLEAEEAGCTGLETLLVMPFSLPHSSHNLRSKRSQGRETAFGKEQCLIEISWRLEQRSEVFPMVNEPLPKVAVLEAEDTAVNKISILKEQRTDKIRKIQCVYYIFPLGTKRSYQKPVTNLILNGKNLKPFPVVYKYWRKKSGEKNHQVLGFGKGQI